MKSSWRWAIISIAALAPIVAYAQSSQRYRWSAVPSVEVSPSTIPRADTSASPSMTTKGAWRVQLTDTSGGDYAASAGGGGSTPTGTAGTPNAAVVTVQGISGGTVVPVSGTVTTTPPSNASSNVAQINGVTPLMGNGVTGTGSLRVTIASDNTSNTNAFKVDGSAVTQPVSIADVFGTVTASSAATMTGMGASGIIDTSGFQAFLLQVTANAGSNSITVETTNDSSFATGVTSAVLFGLSTYATTATISATGTLYVAPAMQRYLRLRISTYVSGSTSVDVSLRKNPFPGPWYGGNSGNPSFTSVVPNTTSAAANTPVVTSAVASNLVVKASAGNLHKWHVTSGATAGLVMIFNATSAPADGAVTPIKCMTLAANNTIGDDGQVPTRFSTGITIVFSTGTNCFSKTASATAFIEGEAQ